MFGLHYRGGSNLDTAAGDDRFRNLTLSEADGARAQDLSRAFRRQWHPVSWSGCESRSSRTAQVLAVGRDGMLTQAEIQSVIGYTHSLSPKRQVADSLVGKGDAGKTTHTGKCPACCGDDDKSKVDLRAPDLTDNKWSHALPASDAFGWLAAGWSDLTENPVPSLIYGFLVFLMALGVVASIVAFGRYYVLVAILAGFMIVGPLLAVGLYEKSRRLAMGERVGLSQMIFVKPALGGQVLFTGVLLCLLILVLRPLPGLDLIAPMLFTTRVGWAMVLVGGAVGVLFAAFSFAISVFGIPIQLDRRVDALTAMGASMALVWNNLPVMLVWGGVVLGLLLLSLATGLLGLIVVFPLLGHGTWYAYRAIAS